MCGGCINLGLLSFSGFFSIFGMFGLEQEDRRNNVGRVSLLGVFFLNLSFSILFSFLPLSFLFLCRCPLGTSPHHSFYSKKETLSNRILLLC
ncbi:hypothetical protein LINPERPRIM_LOCUS38441, partial [Linum perenne]